MIADKINELFQIFEPALIFKEYFFFKRSGIQYCQEIQEINI